MKFISFSEFKMVATKHKKHWRSLTHCRIFFRLIKIIQYCRLFFLPLNLFYRICWFYIFIFFREVLKFWMQHFKLLCMSPLLPPLCITICTTVRKLFDILLVVELLIYSKNVFSFSRIKTNYLFKSIIITSPIGFNIALTNVHARLKQRWYNFVSTLFWRCVTLFRRSFNVGHWRCINVVQRWKSDVGFCFIFNVGSTLFQRWSRTLKQRWSDVEMLTGLFSGPTG